MIYVISAWVSAAVEKLEQNPEDIGLLENIVDTLEILKPLRLLLDIWNTQNIYFSLGKNVYEGINQKALDGDGFSKRWISAFHKFGTHLHVNVTE